MVDLSINYKDLSTDVGVFAGQTFGWNQPCDRMAHIRVVDDMNYRYLSSKQWHLSDRKSWVWPWKNNDFDQWILIGRGPSSALFSSSLARLLSKTNNDAASLISPTSIQKTRSTSMSNSLQLMILSLVSEVKHMHTDGTRSFCMLSLIFFRDLRDVEVNEIMKQVDSCGQFVHNLQGVLAHVPCPQEPGSSRGSVSYPSTSRLQWLSAGCARPIQGAFLESTRSGGQVSHLALGHQWSPEPVPWAKVSSRLRQPAFVLQIALVLQIQHTSCNPTKAPRAAAKVTTKTPHPWLPPKAEGQVLPKLVPVKAESTPQAWAEYHQSLLLKDLTGPQ